MDSQVDVLPNLQIAKSVKEDIANLQAGLLLQDTLQKILPTLNITLNSYGYLQALLQIANVVGLALDCLNSVTSKNATSSSESPYAAAMACWKYFDVVELVIIAGFILIPVTVLLSFTIKRDKACLDSCNGRPGVAYPWETLKYVRGRSRLALAILLLCYPTFLLLTEASVVFEILTPSTSWATTPLKLACMVITGISLHPIFFSITKPCLLTLSVSVIVSAYFAVTAALPTLYCSDKVSGLATLIEFAFALPSVLAAVILTVMLLIDAVKSIRGDRWLQPTDMVLDILYGSYYTSKENYVRQLLNRRVQQAASDSASTVKSDSNIAIVADTVSNGNANGIPLATSECGRSRSRRAKVKELWNKIRYKSIDGFYYPSAVLCSFAAALVLIYYMGLLGILFMVDIKNWLNSEWFQPFLAQFGDQRSINEVYADVITNEKLNWSLLLRPRNLIPISNYCFNTLIYVLITSSVLATLNGIIVLVLMFFNYRSNTIDAYSGVYKDLAHRSSVTAGSAVVGQCRFGGYQIAYSAWAMFLQFFVYAIALGVVWYGILMPIAFRYKPWYYGMILYDWPSILISIILALVQSFVPGYAFVAGKGTKLGIKRRSIFLVWNFYSFIISAALGLISCILRLVYAFVVAFVFLSRLDWCSMPPKFRFLDGGHCAYVGQLITDVYHSHPIVITFIEIAKKSAYVNLNYTHRGSASDPYLHSISSLVTDVQLATAETHTCPQPEVDTCDANSTTSSLEQLRTRMRASYRRKVSLKKKWWIAYTLIRNPVLQQHRKLKHGKISEGTTETIL